MANAIITSNQVYTTTDRVGDYLRVPTCGLSARSSLRLVAVFGIIWAVLYIAAGCSILLHLQKVQQQSDEGSTTANLYERNTGDLLWSFSVTLIVANTIQVVYEILLFILSLRTIQWKTMMMWSCCIVDRILFVITICSSLTIINLVASQQGIFLLVVLLFGIAIRVYAMFVFRQSVTDLRVANGKPSSFELCYPMILCFPM